VKATPIATDENLAIAVTTITPAIAKKWVEKANHPDNRPVSWGRVESFANDMRAGNWRTTHQGICFDAQGRLIDGQHRLHAIVASGVSVSLVVTTNKMANIHDPIDRGRPRSLATVTGLHSRDASAMTMLHRLTIGMPTSSNPVTEAEILAMWESQKKWVDRLAADSRILRSKLLAGTYAAAVWTLPIDTDAVLDFMGKVISGEMIQKGDPAYAFRRWYERAERPPPVTMCFAALNCIRHHVQNLKLAMVYDTEIGYRASVSKRRAMKIPGTPGTDLGLSQWWPL
jgi:hypothetical protein